MVRSPTVKFSDNLYDSGKSVLFAIDSSFCVFEGLIFGAGVKSGSGIVIFPGIGIPDKTDSKDARLPVEDVIPYCKIAPAKSSSDIVSP